MTNQIDSFKEFQDNLIEQCNRTFPETLDYAALNCRIATRMMKRVPVSEQRARWVHAMNASFQLMQVADMSYDVWAKAIIFRWIWDWEIANG